MNERLSNLVAVVHNTGRAKKVITIAVAEFIINLSFQNSKW